MILVDSSVWIDYFNGTNSWQTNRLDLLLQRELIITGDIILAEVLQGFRNHSHYSKARTALMVFPCYTLCGREVALESASNYRLLREKGITIRKTIDMIIGTFCMTNNYQLLHGDRDFDYLALHLGLRTIEP